MQGGSTTSYPSPPASITAVSPARSISDPEILANTQHLAALHDVHECERECERVGDIVGFGWTAKTEEPRDHRVDLFLASAPRSDERAFHARMPERVDRDAGLRARQAEHAPRVPHQQRRTRIGVARVELLDHDQSRLGRLDDLAYAGVQLAKALFEGRVRTRNHDARLDQTHSSVAALDCAVTGGSQRGIDAQDSHSVGLQGGGIPLTVKVTADPGASLVPAPGSVPTTLPSAPTVVVYSRRPTEYP